MITDKVDLSTNQRCDCGLSQIIRLNVITFSALLNDGMTTYRSSHSTQFPFFLGSVQLIQPTVRTMIQMTKKIYYKVFLIGMIVLCVFLE